MPGGFTVNLDYTLHEPGNGKRNTPHTTNHNRHTSPGTKQGKDNTNDTNKAAHGSI